MKTSNKFDIMIINLDNIYIQYNYFIISKNEARFTALFLYLVAF